MSLQTLTHGKGCVPETHYVLCINFKADMLLIFVFLVVGIFSFVCASLEGRLLSHAATAYNVY